MHLQIVQMLQLEIVRLVEVFCALEKACCREIDLTLDVELGSMDVENASIFAGQLNDLTTFLEVALNLLDSGFNLIDLRGFAESYEVVSSFEESSLDFKDVEQSLTSEFFSMRAQQNVVFSFFGELVGIDDCLVEIDIFKEGSDILGEGITVL